MKVNISFSDGTYKYLDNPSKRKMAGLYSRLTGKSGTCRVSYTRTYYNEFQFDGGEDFRRKILPCLEEELIKEFSVQERTNK